MVQAISAGKVTLYELEQQEVPRYARSREFILENHGDLEIVLQVMNRLAALVETA